MRGIPDALEDAVGAILAYCEGRPFAAFLLNMTAIGIVIMVAAFVLTVIIPVILIVILLIGKYCVPIAVAIFTALSTLLNL